MPTLEVTYRAVSLHVAISIFIKYEIAVFYRFKDMDASQNFKRGHVTLARWEALTPGQTDPKTHPPPKPICGCTERYNLLKVTRGCDQGTKKYARVQIHPFLTHYPFAAYTVFAM